DQAVRWGNTMRNPCDSVDRPQPPKFEISPLTKDQAETFLAESARDPKKKTPPHPDEALFVTAVGTGARISELLALRWTDVDLKAKTASIQRTLTKAGGQLAIKEPKTKTGRRRIKLDNATVTAL